MINLWLFGFHVIDRQSVRTYVSTYVSTKCSGGVMWDYKNVGRGVQGVQLCWLLNIMSWSASAYIFHVEHPWYWFLRFAPCMDSTLCIPDSRYWTLDALAVERGFWFSIVSGIPDSRKKIFSIPWKQITFRTGWFLVFDSAMLVV